MIRILLTILAAFAIVFAGLPPSIAWAQSPANEEEFITLFDGKTLDGWTMADGKPVTRGWEAVDGQLVRTGRGGAIYSKQEYGDFELRFDWRISSRGNSGVKYRVAYYESGIYGHPGWLGYEYQIWDDANRDSDPNTSASALYMLQAPNDSKRLEPTGEFNTARIVAKGPHIEHWLNGERVLHVDTSTVEWSQRIQQTKFGVVDDIFTNASGRIQLQDHGSKVWLRNIRIRELEDE